MYDVASNINCLVKLPAHKCDCFVNNPFRKCACTDLVIFHFNKDHLGYTVFTKKE